jgi:predicted ArsR family transcriptional regulator
MGRRQVKRVLVAEFLAERQRATAREVAHGLQLSVGDASLQLHRLQQAGVVTTVEHVRVEHAKRPVAVYGPSPAPAIFNDAWLRGR